MAWIDYHKAFDSVPHSWILKVLDLFKISSFLINFFRIKHANTGITLNVTHQNGNLKSKPIKISIKYFSRWFPITITFLPINILFKRPKSNRIWL